MKNRVTVRIAGQTYTLLSEDSEDYMKEIAQKVDTAIGELRARTTISEVNAAVLTAMNFADDAAKAAASADNMRAQMKSYLDDASRLRSELNEARREIARLKQPNNYRR